MKKIYFYIIVFIMLLFCGCGRQVNPLPPIETARIGTMIGSTNEILAQKKYPKADIKRFNNYVDESAALLANKLDYAMIDYALGFSKRSNFLKVTLPQALRHIIPIFKGEFISMVKMTSVVGYIVIQDLTKMSDIIRSRTFDAFFPLFATAFIYFVITCLFIMALGKIEQHIDPKRRKRIVKGIMQPADRETEVRI
jgi:hypothetical protein